MPKKLLAALALLAAIAAAIAAGFALAPDWPSGLSLPTRRAPLRGAPPGRATGSTRCPSPTGLMR